MKIIIKYFTFLSMFFVLSNINAQDELFVPAPVNEAVYLNEIIMGDTVAGGGRASENRVYVLERGGVWLTESAISNVGWTLRIKASEGDGPKPIVYNLLNRATGGTNEHIFRAEGDLYISDLVINGYLEAQEGAYDNQSIAAVLIYGLSPDLTIMLDGCVLGNAKSQLIRTDAAMKLLHVENSLFGNFSAWPYKSHWQPRVWDGRSAGAESIIFRNNTMINGHGKVLRRRSSTAAANYIEFVHNTVVNQTGRGGVLGLGMIDGDVVIKDNLFVDCFLEGSDTNSTVQNDFLESGETWDGIITGFEGKARQAWIYHTRDASPTSNFYVENNYFHYTPEMSAAYDNIIANLNPGQQGVNSPILSLYIDENNMSTGTAFTNEVIEFVDVPAPMADLITWMQTPEADGGAYPGSGGGSTPNYPGFDKRTIDYYMNTMDLTYPTSTAAYNGSSQGLPVGDLNWYPEKKALWNEGGYVILDELFVPAPVNEAVYLNEIIMGDTVAGGGRASENRVYVLERGGVWLTESAISNVGWTLRIKASEGDGPKPIVYNLLNRATGGTNEHIFRAEGDLYISDLVINGYLEAQEGAYDNQSIAAVLIYGLSPDLTIMLDGCVLGNAKSQLIRTDAAMKLLHVENSLFGNFSAWPYKSHWQPRVWDGRSAGAESIIFRNNTMINGHGKVLRRRSSTAAANYIEFVHNTVVNQTGRGGVLGLGMIDGDVVIKDNLFVDCFLEGSDTNSTVQNDFLESGETWDGIITGFEGKARQAWIYHTRDASPTSNFYVENNYFHYTPEMSAAYDNIIANLNPGQQGVNSPILSLYIDENNMSTGTAFTNEVIEFVDVPAPMADLITWMQTPEADGGAYPGSGGGSTPNYPGFDKRTIDYYMNTMDLTYPTSTAAYTGATDGYPVGDLNWFPNVVVSVENISDVVPQEYALEQNYPNPFNPSTNIRFSLPESGIATLNIYNMIGQKVATLVNEELKAGQYNYNFDASNLASGIYVYQLSTQSFVTAKKMLLLK